MEAFEIWAVAKSRVSRILFAAKIGQYTVRDVGKGCVIRELNLKWQNGHQGYTLGYVKNATCLYSTDRSIKKKKLGTENLKRITGIDFRVIYLQFLDLLNEIKNGPKIILGPVWPFL